MENVKAFHNELKSIYEGKPPVSKARMNFITKAAFKAIKFYKHVVLEVEKFAQKAPSEYKLAALYVIDSIVRQSRHQNGHETDVFGPRFAKNFKQTFSNILQCSTEDKSKVIKVLNLWQKNGTFPTELIQMLLDISNPNNADKSNDMINNGSIKKSHKEFAEEAFKVVNDLLEKCGKDPQAMGINPQHYQQLEVIGKYLKQQLDNKNHNISDGSDGNSITVDAKVVTQLRELAAQLFGKVNNSQDHHNSAKSDKTKSLHNISNSHNEELQTVTKREHINVPAPSVNDVELSGFNKKLLDFDYGDEDDESPNYYKDNQGEVNKNKEVTGQEYYNNTSLHSHPFSSFPAIDPTIKEAAQKILTDPGIIKELQNMTPLIYDSSKYSNDLRKQILAQQQEEFDKEIQNSLHCVSMSQFTHIPGLSPQNTFLGSYSNSYSSNHTKGYNFMAPSNLTNAPPLPPGPANLKDVPLPSVPCPFSIKPSSNNGSNILTYTGPTFGLTLDGQGGDYLRYKPIGQSDMDFRSRDYDERHGGSKSSGQEPTRDRNMANSFNSNTSGHHGKPAHPKGADERERERDRTGNKRDRVSDNRKDSHKRHHKDSPPKRSDNRRRDHHSTPSTSSKRRPVDGDRKESDHHHHHATTPVTTKPNCITILSRTLWIGRVPKSATEADLKQAFEEYNITTECIQMVPPRGCAYVTFNTRQDAAKILDRMKDKYKLFGKTLQVNWSPFKGLKDTKNLKQFWDESVGVYYLPQDKVDTAAVNDYNDGGIVDWESVPSGLKGRMQEMVTHYSLSDPSDSTQSAQAVLSNLAKGKTAPPDINAFNMPPPIGLPGLPPFQQHTSPNFGTAVPFNGQQGFSQPLNFRPAFKNGNFEVSMPHSYSQYPPFPDGINAQANHNLNNSYSSQRYPPMQMQPPPPSNLAQARGSFPNFPVQQLNTSTRFPRYALNNSSVGDGNVVEPLSTISETDGSSAAEGEDLSRSFNVLPTNAFLGNLTSPQPPESPFSHNLNFNRFPGNNLMAAQRHLLLQQNQVFARSQRAAMMQGSARLPPTIPINFQGNQHFPRFQQRAFHPRFSPQMAPHMMGGGGGMRPNVMNPLFMAGMRNAVRARLMMAPGGQHTFSANQYGNVHHQMDMLQDGAIPAPSHPAWNNQNYDNHQGEEKSEAHHQEFSPNNAWNDDNRAHHVVENVAKSFQMPLETEPHPLPHSKPRDETPTPFTLTEDLDVVLIPKSVEAENESLSPVLNTESHTLWRDGTKEDKDDAGGDNEGLEHEIKEVTSIHMIMDSVKMQDPSYPGGYGTNDQLEISQQSNCDVDVVGDDD